MSLPVAICYKMNDIYYIGFLKMHLPTMIKSKILYKCAGML